MVFVLGNTGTGKTSLVKTFESLVKSPSKEPTSVLTKPGDHLIETQVLEVYDELSMNKDKTYKVELEGNSGGPTLVKLDENKEKESMEEAGKRERLQLKLVDMGEMNFSIRVYKRKFYFSVCLSSLFPASNIE